MLQSSSSRFFLLVPLFAEFNNNHCPIGLATTNMFDFFRFLKRNTKKIRIFVKKKGVGSLLSFPTPFSDSDQRSRCIFIPA